MASNKFNLALYLISSVDNRWKFCINGCNKYVLAKNFKNHLLSKKHKQRESELDFLSDCEPQEKFFSFVYFVTKMVSLWILRIICFVKNTKYQN